MSLDDEVRRSLEAAASSHTPSAPSTAAVTAAARRRRTRVATAVGSSALVIVVALAIVLSQTGGSPPRAQLGAAGRAPDDATTTAVGPPAGSVEGAGTTTSTMNGATGTAGTGYSPPGSIVYPGVSTTATAPRPTGSTVPRTTPTAAPIPVQGSGVRGTITAGPTCPVERAGQPCPPNPVQAEVDARDNAGHTVQSTQSDSEGRYAMSLAPGDYTLVVVTGSSFPRCPDTPVTVKPNQVTTADISCDTGIR